MNALTFDTHRFVKRLTTAGMPEAQAEILAEEQTKLIDERLVTKTYLRAELAKLETRLTIRLGVVMATTVGIITALEKLL